MIEKIYFFVKNITIINTMEKNNNWVDFTKDCEETKFFDLVIQCEDKRFMFHRCLLNKYSYFNNILSGQYTKEMNKNRIQITKFDVEHEVISYFLNYVYNKEKFIAKPSIGDFNFATYLQIEKYINDITLDINLNEEITNILCGLDNLSELLIIRILKYFGLNELRAERNIDWNKFNDITLKKIFELNMHPTLYLSLIIESYNRFGLEVLKYINPQIKITSDMILNRRKDIDEFLFNQLKYMLSYRLCYTLVSGRSIFISVNMIETATEFKKIDK